jgi:hypothetical protein
MYPDIVPHFFTKEADVNLLPVRVYALAGPFSTLIGEIFGLGLLVLVVK